MPTTCTGSRAAFPRTLAGRHGPHRTARPAGGSPPRMRPPPAPRWPCWPPSTSRSPHSKRGSMPIFVVTRTLRSCCPNQAWPRSSVPGCSPSSVTTPPATPPQRTARTMPAPARSTGTSGKRKLVAARYVHNDRLVDALMRQAQSALQTSPGARAYYDRSTRPRARPQPRAAPARQPARRHPARVPQDPHPLRRDDRMVTSRRQARCLTSEALGCLSLNPWMI